MRESRLVRSATRVSLTVAFVVLCSLALAGGVCPAFDAAEPATVINGPYLLSVTKESITVRWETDKPCDSKIEYGVAASYDRTAHEPQPGIPTPVGTRLHEVELTGLEPGTTYHYQVVTGSAVTEDSTFRTLPDDNEPLKFVVVTDTHFFGTAEAFTKRMLELEPDFIVNCGDMVLSSATEYTQFKIGYFGPAATLLRQIPVVYVHGNHDIGEFWDMYFGVQSERLHSSSGNPYWFSFNAGSAHFIVLDGMPYSDDPDSFISSYQELKGKFDAYVRRFFADNSAEKELTWLAHDLSSEAARGASWRFIFQHYPYTNDRVYEVLSPVMENYDVHAFWSGDTHRYDRAILWNPDGTPKRLLMVCGSGQQAEAKMDYGRGEPDNEPVAYGNCDYILVQVQGDTMVVESHTVIPGAGEGPTGLLDRFTFTKNERPEVAYRDLRVSPGKVNTGEPFTVCATIENRGKTGTIEKVDLYIDGKHVRSIWVNVDAGERKQASFTADLYTLGDHQVGIGGLGSETVIVEAASPF